NYIHCNDGSNKPTPAHDIDEKSFYCKTPLKKFSFSLGYLDSIISEPAIIENVKKQKTCRNTKRACEREYQSIFQTTFFPKIEYHSRKKEQRSLFCKIARAEY